MAYSIHILDANLTFKGIVKNLDDLDNQRTYLKYGQQLSHWGTATFRVGTKDPLFTKLGDLSLPLENHVQIYKGSQLVWQGLIIKNTQRNPFFIECEAATYEWLLNKILIRHDSSAAYPADGNNYAHYTSGTMQSVIQTIISNAQADGGGFLSQLSAGNIPNPTFPAGFIDSNGVALSGQPWDFSKLPIKFNYVSVYYVLNAFGAYTKYDFSIDLNRNINFQSLIGTNKTNLSFFYGALGQIEHYNIIYNGEKFANYLIGVAADDAGNVLTSTKWDDASITKYGKIMNVQAFADIKAQSYLDARTKGEVEYTANFPSELQLTLNKRAYPLGQWGIGDIVTVIINDHVTQYNQPQQIVRYEVDVKDSGTEEIRLFTNSPLPDTF